MTQEEFNNLGVGKLFVLGCRKFIVVESGIDCSKCSFDKMKDCLCTSLRTEHFIPECSGRIRRDAKDVIFMEVQNESLE
ncbi:MAG: hypothetical protein SOR11_04810 [Fusobacterium sp.]|uniref:hypothetical protein n=1 Tax=Fusobacterium sp. TaxID=68766 RepID=UPI002A74BA41|nr:hypothetical protein [Fusobacterium sp.]MDY3059304.1 hypothetical protein [Fusobacterium sp.]